MPWDLNPDLKRIFLNFSQWPLCHCCVQEGGTGAEKQENEGGGYPTLARPGGQEQQPAFFCGLSGATSTSEPFRWSSCILRDLHGDSQTSVLSHLPGRGHGCSCGGVSHLLCPPYIPHGTRKGGHGEFSLLSPFWPTSQLTCARHCARDSDYDSEACMPLPGLVRETEKG